MDQGYLADHGGGPDDPLALAGVVLAQFDLLIAGAGTVLAINPCPAAQQLLPIVDDGTFPALDLAIGQDDHPGLEAVVVGVPLGHLHIAALAQHDGGGSVVALVVVVDEVGLFGEGVEVVGPAGLQKDLALGVGGLGADEVPHVLKADGEMLAVGGLDLHRLGGSGRGHGGAAGRLKLGCCLGGTGGGVGRCGALAVACECHGMYLLYLCTFVAYLMEPKRKPRSAAAALNQATSSGVNSTQNR